MSTAKDIFTAIIDGDNINLTEHNATELYNRSLEKVELMKETFGKSLFKEAYDSDYREGLKDATREDNANTFTKEVEAKLKKYKHDYDGDVNKPNEKNTNTFSKEYDNDTVKKWKESKKINSKKWY